MILLGSSYEILEDLLGSSMSDIGTPVLLLCSSPVLLPRLCLVFAVLLASSPMLSAGFSYAFPVNPL